MDLSSWISAFRLRTLPLALACIGMGGFLAASVGLFDSIVFALAISTTLLLQILSNLANDFGDSFHGADNAARQGPQRAVQSGAISALAMKRALYIAGFLALISGVALLWVALENRIQDFLVFLGIGILCIIAAVAYTNGKRPYGYMGLGDASVFVFFGLVGVLGTYFLLTGVLPKWEWLPAATCGLFATGVLNINNIRDIQSDKVAGKYSLPVRIGNSAARKYHVVLLIAGWSAAITYTLVTSGSYWRWMYLLALPLFSLNAVGVLKRKSEQLDPLLRQLAMATLLFVVLFGIGLLV